MTVLLTPRLRLRELDAGSSDDAAYLLELLNQRSFIDNIADRGVRTPDDAVRYMLEGPVESYRRHGFGLWRVERRDDAEPLGLCGLLKRDYFDHPDIGYALLDRHHGKGYAFEAAAATLAWGWNERGLARIVASTAPDNDDSIRLLQRLGFRFDRMVSLPAHAGESRYFVMDSPLAATPD
jgi:[ribosomal protein S5]-alanine N-acetyltransferase